jgi:hypothetical protein
VTRQKNEDQKNKKKRKEKKQREKSCRNEKKNKSVASQAGCSIALMHATTIANVLCWATDDINQ